MSVLNFGQIETLWVQNGGDPKWAPLAAGIAMAESGGDTGALNNNPSTGDYSVGLWQINYFANLLGPRSASYGSPSELLKDPNRQAAAAVNLSGNGANWQPWQTDRAWNAWVAAGRPPGPSAQTVQGWLAGAGVPTGGAAAASLPSGPTAAGKAAGSGGTLGCRASGDVFGEGGFLGIGSFHFTHCEAKALLAGFMVAGGVMVMGLGTVIVVAWGIAGTRAGQAVSGAVGALPGPVGAVGKTARRIGQAPGAARQRRSDARLEEAAAEADLDQFGTTEPTRAQRTAADRELRRRSTRIVEGAPARRRGFGPRSPDAFTPSAGDA